MFNPEKEMDSFFERKADYFLEHTSPAEKKLWYYTSYPGYRYIIRLNRRIKWLSKLNLPLHLSFARWIIIDLMRGKKKRFWGIYQFVGLPGEGKTMSMVAHIKRALASHQELVVATNFHFKGETYAISHWIDIVKIALDAKKRNIPCIIAIDEIQNTFDASEWQKFPRALYALLSFNRKLNLQFLCSAQIYERIPSKIRNLANYTVICKNVMKADRYFISYYFEKNNYETSFNGKRVKADFIREFIADDEMYASYDTFEQVKAIAAQAQEEKSKKKEAFELLFGNSEDAEPEEKATA